jgi:transposase
MSEALARPGEANPRAILTEEQVLLIYRLASERTYSQRQIAQMFQVGQRTVVDILQKKTWRCLWERQSEDNV